MDQMQHLVLEAMTILSSQTPREVGSSRVWPLPTLTWSRPPSRVLYLTIRVTVLHLLFSIISTNSSVLFLSYVSLFLLTC